MKVLAILTDGFEDTEGLGTIDILRRANIEVVTASPTKSKKIITQYQQPLETMTLLSDVDVDGFIALFIPGGGAVFKVLDHNKEVESIIHHFVQNDKLVCSICAGPHLIGKHGYFKNHKYTCYPHCDKEIKEGLRLNEGVVVDGNFITGKSMYYTSLFALEIVRRLKGEEEYTKVLKAIKGEN